MKLKEIFELLSSGEFSQLSIGGADQGVINESNQARVIGHLQLGLTSLYTRFNLKERRISFPINPNADTYAIQADDLLRIEKVLLDSGTELKLNDGADPFSCFTPSMRSIRLPKAVVKQENGIPEELLTTNATVVYRANHPKIMSSSGFVNIETKTVEIPMTHLQALLYFVAARAHTPMGMANTEGQVGNNWFQYYEAECQRLATGGFQIAPVEEPDRLRSNGWV